MYAFLTMPVHRTPRRALPVAMAAALAVLGLSACSAGAPGGPGPSSAAGTFNESDVQFAQMMIPHHQQAVAMTDLAQIRATDPQLKQVANQIRAVQDQEVTMMAGWLAGWGQPTAQAGGHNMSGMSGVPGMMSEQDMAELAAATGVDFDRMFARMMITHHNGAIQMCRQLSGAGQHGGARSLATMIEQTRVAEVATLETILDRL